MVFLIIWEMHPAWLYPEWSGPHYTDYPHALDCFVILSAIGDTPERWYALPFTEPDEDTEQPVFDLSNLDSFRSFENVV